MSTRCYSHPLVRSMPAGSRCCCLRWQKQQPAVMAASRLGAQGHAGTQLRAPTTKLGPAQPSCSRAPPLQPFFQPETQICCSADRQPLGRRPIHPTTVRFALYLCHATTPAISTPGHAATPRLATPLSYSTPCCLFAPTFSLPFFSMCIKHAARRPLHDVSRRCPPCCTPTRPHRLHHTAPVLHVSFRSL